MHESKEEQQQQMETKDEFKASRPRSEPADVCVELLTYRVYLLYV
jgi:hypothetical protein